MRVRYLMATFVALAAALGFASTPTPASAQTVCPSTAGSQYAPGAPALQLARSEARPGEQIVVSGRCCPPNTIVVISFTPGPVPLGSAQAGPDGSFSTSVTIPANATPGLHDIVATAPGCTVSAAVNVLGAAIDRGTGGTRLPRTGVSTIPFVIAGLALVLIGTMTVLATRRRRAAAL